MSKTVKKIIVQRQHKKGCNVENGLYLSDVVSFEDKLYALIRCDDYSCPGQAIIHESLIGENNAQK